MKRLSGGNRIVLLTVGMIALAGLLVGSGSYLRTRSLADSYDKAMQTELQQKGYGIATTANFFLTALGPSALTNLQGFATQGFSQSQNVVQGRAQTPGTFNNTILKLEVWSPAPTSYSAVYEQTLTGQTLAKPTQGSRAVITSVAASGNPVSTIDEGEHALQIYVPISTAAQARLVLVGTLDASQEFSFFAAQRHRAIRDAIIFAVGSVAFVALVGAVLSLLVSRTLTNRQRAEDALRDSELRYRTLAELSPVGIFRNDREGKNIYSNQRVQEMLDLTPEASFGEGWANGLHPDDRERVLAEWAEAMRFDTPFRSEYRFVRGDGVVVWVLGQAAAERTAHGEVVGYVGTATDITERMQAEERLREQTRRDPLTGVLNHAAIVEELRRLVSSGDGASSALAMVDVDGMKAINDTHGHQVGDEALRTVARALQRRGAVVGRYGGDEFTAILPGADREVTKLYRQEVAAELARTLLPDPDTRANVLLAASIGFAMFPDEAGAIVDLIKLADSAMYAQRRQRPAAMGSRPRRSPGDERAARMIGEIVPLLTSPGAIKPKLHFVAQRLLLGIGVDAVTAVLFSPQPGGPAVSSTVARVDQEIVRAWDEVQGVEGEASTLRALLEQVQRPFIMDNLASDDRLSAAQRELLTKADLHSGLVAPMIWQGQTLGALAVGSKRASAFGPRDAQLLNAVAGQVTAIVRMETLVEELQSASGRLTQAREETVMLLAAAAEAHDGMTGQHLKRMRTLVEALARELGQGEEEIRELGLAAVLHDIGKLFLPEHVLASPGKLDNDEWQLMKRHCVHGQTFLAGKAGFELAATIARSHHERWDGAGYPDGLCVGEISDAAAVVTVADAFDAMTSERSYRQASSVGDAMAEIVDGSGKQFSPRVVEAFVRLYERGALLVDVAEPARRAA